MKFYEYLEQENITPLDIITDAERMEDLCHKIEGCHECPLKIPSCYLDVECNDRERNLIENNMKRLMEKESKKKNKSKQKPAIGAECCEEVKKMTREGAEKVRDALKMILEQCEATMSCKNCPLYDCEDSFCNDLFDCISDN